VTSLRGESSLSLNDSSDVSPAASNVRGIVPGPSGPERGGPFPPGSKQSTIVACHFSGALLELRPELRVKAADAAHSAIE